MNKDEIIEHIRKYVRDHHEYDYKEDAFDTRPQVKKIELSEYLEQYDPEIKYKTFTSILEELKKDDKIYAIEGEDVYFNEDFIEEEA